MNGNPTKLSADNTTAITPKITDVDVFEYYYIHY